MLLFSLLFSSCDKNYSLWTLERCRITKEGSYFTYSEKEQTTAIYLHKTSKSKLIFDSKSNLEVKPGEGYRINGEAVKVHCSGGDCDISLWYTNYDKEGGFIVADSAGAVYNITGLLPNRYTSFFDFGDTARIRASNLTHPRTSGIEFNFQNESGMQQVFMHSDEEYDFSSPGILQITASAFNQISISIIAGSTKKMSQEFAQDDKIAKFNGQEGDDVICKVSAQAKVAYIQWSLVGLTILTFVLSIINSICLFSCSKKDQKPQENQLAAEQPLVQ